MNAGGEPCKKKTRHPPRRLRKVFALEDFEELARRRLPRPIFGYIAGAAERNQSLADNHHAFDEISFVPRVLRDISARDLSCRVMGLEFSLPFGIAPMGISALSAFRGDVVQAVAAREAGIPMILSGSSLMRMEDVRAAAPGTWFQAYLPGDRDGMDRLVARTHEAGFEVLVITVDTAVLPSRENNLRNGFQTPMRPSLRLL